MKIEYIYGETRSAYSECIIAIGFFDGVHIAHRELIKTAIEEGKRLSLPVGVFTFGDSESIKKDSSRLYSDSEKEDIISSLGVDFTVFADFNSLRDLSKDEFIDTVLIRDFGCRVAVVGYNFRFGKGALGNAEYLKSSLNIKGRECIVKGEVAFLGRTVSSSYVKELIGAGRINEANRLLGHPYFFSATVERGDGRGRALGFPTVNLSVGDKERILKRGVYRSLVAVDGGLYSAVTNIGTCPTFEERDIHSESYIIGCDEVLYGKQIKVFLLEYLREEHAFENAESLKSQINIDKNKVIKKNEEEKWQVYGLS